jgi:hypothetical protein
MLEQRMRQRSVDGTVSCRQRLDRTGYERGGFPTTGLGHRLPAQNQLRARRSPRRSGKDGVTERVVQQREQRSGDLAVDPTRSGGDRVCTDVGPQQGVRCVYLDRRSLGVEWGDAL